MQGLTHLASRTRRQCLQLLRHVGTLANASTTQLLQHPEGFTSPSQLGPSALETLAVFLGMKEEMYQQYAKNGLDDKVVSAMFAGMNADLKRTLIQKLVATSGVRATPLLLAWSSEEIRKSVLSHVSSKTLSPADLYSVPWLHDLLPLATSAADSTTGKPADDWTVAELAAVRSWLQAAGALRWSDLLALPHLQQLLQHVSQQNPLLGATLVRLGMLPTAQQPPAAESAVPASGTAVTPSQLQLQAKQYIADKLKLDTSQGIPVGLVTRLLQQKAAIPQDLAIGVTVLRLAQHAHAATGQSLPSTAATLLQLLGCLPQKQPVLLEPAAVQAAAAELLSYGSQQQPPATVKQLHQLSPEELHSQLKAAAAAKPGGAVAKLVQDMQDARVALLVKGSPWALCTATAADVAALTPSQFWHLRQHAQKQASAGTQLLRQLFSSPSGSSHSLLKTVSRLPQSDREALAWVVLSAGTDQQQEVTGKLMQSFTHQAGSVVSDLDASAQAAAELAQVAVLEKQVADLDYLGSRQHSPLELPASPADRQQSDSSTAPPGTQLPTSEQLAVARASLPESDHLLFDLLVQDMSQSGQQVSDQRLSEAFQAMFSGSPALLDVADNTPPAALAEWVQSAKRSLIGLSPAALSVLSQFLELRVARDKEGAEKVQDRMRQLLKEVQAAVSASNKGTPSASTAAAAKAANPYWLSPLAEQRRSGQAQASSDKDLPSPEVVTALLGPLEGQQYVAWLTATEMTSDKPLQPYQMLDDVHREQDKQRYLLMEHDPQLHVVWDRVPRPWTEPTPHTAPDQFLEDMRPLLDRYLAARGMRPLVDSEWSVYRDSALTEFTQQRLSHEEALRSQGHSAFFNSRAEAVYLRSLLSAGIAPTAPLYQQAQRYLTVLETNSSWTFAQRKRVVQRLIELSAHFAAQPPPSERGSPFAPLFAPGSQVKLVPELKPWKEARAEAEQPVSM